MKVAEYWKLVEAKAIELRDLLNSLLKLTTSTYNSVFTVEDILKRPSLAGTTLDWEFRTDKRRHVVVLYAEYLKLSAELSSMLSATVVAEDVLTGRDMCAVGHYINNESAATPGLHLESDTQKTRGQPDTSPKNSPPTAAASISPSTLL
jgi:hypothetical protein